MATKDPFDLIREALEQGRSAEASDWYDNNTRAETLGKVLAPYNDALGELAKLEWRFAEERE